jgi:apolipoprotein N-acyltransferase
LICFEDLFAELGRKAVKRGAKMLVNITNDAWFDGSSENELHFRQAVLRAIENGVPLVRVANTGITGIIYPNGLTNRFMEGNKQAAGFMTLSVPIPEGELLPTPYQRYGDWGFGLPAGILALAWGLVGWRKNNAKA